MSLYVPPQGGNASFPTVGLITTPKYSIWESGFSQGSGVYSAVRNVDGVLVSSGNNFAHLLRTVFNDGGEFTGLIALKGSFVMSSGVVVDVNVQFDGLSPGMTGINVSGITGRVSGAFNVQHGGVEFKNFYFELGSGVMKGIALTSNVNTLKVDNLSVVGTTNSGVNGVHLPAGFNCSVKNCEIDTFDEGVRVDNSIDTTNNCYFKDLTFYTNNTAIMLDNVASHQISNVDANNNTSGGIIIQGSSSKRNQVNQVSASNSGIPVVCVQTSGELNRITNIEHRSAGGYPILDRTSGCRNFFLPGHMDTNAVVISGASPFTYVNASGRQEMIYVGGGTVSQIDFIRRANTIALSGLTAGTFILDGGDKLTVTYSAAPAIKVFPVG